MKYIIYIYAVLLLLLSCGGGKHQSEKTEGMQKAVAVTEVSKPKGLEKLKSLLALPKDSAIEYFDLSNDSIMDFPDLSGYTIKTLDLSFNMLDTLMVKRLPRKVEKLNISHNRLKGMFRLLRGVPTRLKEIDASYNKIERVSISDPLYKLIVSHNALVYVAFDHKNIRYLDISFNPLLSNKVAFYPSLIDTIIREGIANDKPLYNFHEDPAGVVISID